MEIDTAHSKKTNRSEDTARNNTKHKQRQADGHN